MKLKVPLSKRQRIAALLSGADKIGKVQLIDGNYWLEWDDSQTMSILNAVRFATPNHEAGAVPYRSLIINITHEHRTHPNDELFN